MFFFTNYIRIYGAIPLCAIAISHNSGITLLCTTMAFVIIA